MGRQADSQTRRLMGPTWTCCPALTWLMAYAGRGTAVVHVLPVLTPASSKEKFNLSKPRSSLPSERLALSTGMMSRKKAARVSYALQWRLTNVTLSSLRYTLYSSLIMRAPISLLCCETTALAATWPKLATAHSRSPDTDSIASLSSWNLPIASSSNARETSLWNSKNSLVSWSAAKAPDSLNTLILSRISVAQSSILSAKYPPMHLP